MPGIGGFMSFASCFRFALSLFTGAGLVLSNPLWAESTWLEDLTYAHPGESPLSLNLALPEEGEGTHPAVLCVHGGGFSGGQREALNAFCRELAGRGYVAATISYRLAPEHQFPLAVHDVKAALQWLGNHADTYGIDPDRVGVLGVSAGGHLAQLAGYTVGVGFLEGEIRKSRQKVKCVVNIFGTSDLNRIQGRSERAKESIALWLGGRAAEKPHRYVLASPLSWVTPDAPPTLLIHGTEDKIVPFEQSEWMHAALERVGVESILHRMEGVGHTLEGESGKRARDVIHDFLDLHLKGGDAKDLFSGNDLNEWEALGSAEWRVEEGILVGGQDGDPKRSGVLSTKKAFQNFDLEMEFKMDEHGKYNSGVYLRNTPGVAGRRGYQVNLGRGAAEEYVGLYTNRWLDKGDEMDVIRRKLDWNHLRIRADGPHIEVWLNRRKIVDFHDTDARPEFLEAGVISLQTYGAEGHAGWLKFRDIRIFELP